MKILNLVVLSTILTPTITTPLCAVTTRSANFSKALSYDCTESNANFELLNNSNLQLKALMNTEGEFNKLTLNKDYVHNQMFPAHTLYQYFFIDNKWNRNENEHMKKIQKQLLHTHSTTFLNPELEILKTIDVGKPSPFTIPIFSTTGSSNNKKDFTEFNIGNIIQSIIMQNCFQDSTNPNNANLWSAINPTQGYKHLPETGENKAVDINVYNQFGSDTIDSSKYNDIPRKYYPAYCIFCPNGGGYDGHNYVWDWNKNFINNIIDKDTKNNLNGSEALGSISYDVPSNDVKYEEIVNTDKTPVDQNYMIMQHGWFTKIFKGKENILGTDQDSFADYVDFDNHFFDYDDVITKHSMQFDTELRQIDLSTLKNVIDYKGAAVYWHDHVDSYDKNPSWYGGGFLGYAPEDSSRCWANILYCNSNKLLEVERVGKDHDSGKFYMSFDFNKEISKSLLGILYQKQFIENVLNQDFQMIETSDWANDTTLNLSKCFYYHDVLGMDDITGGIKTWMGYDSETGRTVIPENQWSKFKDKLKTLSNMLKKLSKSLILPANLRKSKDFLISKDDNEIDGKNIFLTFQNYFKFKQWFNNFVRENYPKGGDDSTYFPTTLQAIYKELMHGFYDDNNKEVKHEPECYDDSNPFSFCYAKREDILETPIKESADDEPEHKYGFLKTYISTNTEDGTNGEEIVDFGLSVQNLKNLILILPQLKLSQWAMVGKQKHGSEDDIDFENGDQKDNVGYHKTSADEKYSTGEELLKPYPNSSNIYFIEDDKKPTDDKDTLIATNLEIKNSICKNVEDSNSLKNDIEGSSKHKEGTVQNIDKLALLTANAVSIAEPVFYSQTNSTRHNIDNVIRIKKDAKRIEKVDTIEADGILPIHIEINKDALSHTASVIWNRALAANDNNIVKALKSLYICKDKKTNQTTPGTPFIEHEIFDDKYNFDLTSLENGNTDLEVVANDKEGTLTTRLIKKSDSDFGWDNKDDEVIDSYVTKGFALTEPEQPTPFPDPTPGSSHPSKNNTTIIIVSTMGGMLATGGITAGTVIGIKNAKLRKKEKEFAKELSKDKEESK